MSRDASSRRATRLGRLIILTVALPSLLLTALGAAAVANEEAAARTRIEELYEPVGRMIAKSFNEWMSKTIEGDGTRLADLAAWAKAGACGPLPPGFDLDNAGPAVNFFVIEADRALLPEVSDTGPPELVTAFEEATAFDGPLRCAPLERFLEGSSGCPARLALALCRNDDVSWEGLAERCDGPWTGLAVEAARDILRPSTRAERRAEDATRLGLILGGVDRGSPPWLRTLIARRLTRALSSDRTPSGRLARHVLYSVATRFELLESLTTRSRFFAPDRTESAAVAVGRWRRLVIARASSGLLAGYELVPDVVAQALEPVLRERNLEGSMRIELLPTAPPPLWEDPKTKEGEKPYGWWAILSATDLAWQMELPLLEANRWSLTHSRRGLYLWSLILLGVALAGGVGYAVRAIHREGKLSRLKTDFVSSVSHDLRTPLTSIRMFTESLLLDRVKDDRQRREYLEVIARETERLSRLTERILDFSRMEAGRKAYTSLEEEVAPLVHHALQSCSPVIQGSGGRVRVDIPDHLPSVRGDRDALIEVLINLINNAVKYSEEAPDIQITARAEDQDVVLAVTDRGMGIPAAEQKRIFEKFYRVDCRRTSEVGGCGIGLSLVRHIIEAHGGSVGVTSKLGAGSTFFVRLPAHVRPKEVDSLFPATSTTV